MRLPEGLCFPPRRPALLAYSLRRVWRSRPPFNLPSVCKSNWGCKVMRGARTASALCSILLLPSRATVNFAHGPTHFLSSGAAILQWAALLRMWLFMSTKAHVSAACWREKPASGSWITPFTGPQAFSVSLAPPMPFFRECAMCRSSGQMLEMRVAQIDRWPRQNLYSLNEVCGKCETHR